MSRTITISIFLLTLTLCSCKSKKIEGIIIPETQYAHQDYQTNKKLKNIVQEVLNENEKAVPNLKNFPCGGSAGCYDLGFVLTQIIYRIGEEKFNQMVFKLETTEVRGLYSLIEVGLQYGDHNKDGMVDNRSIEKEFPILNETLKK